MPEFAQCRRATARPEDERRAMAERAPLEPGRLYRDVVTSDPADPGRVVMPEEQLAGLDDAMAVTFFRAGLFPLTLAEVMAGLDEMGLVPEVKSYLIGEAGQFPDAPEAVRDFRFAIVRGPGSDADLMISTSASDASEQAFLQVAAWDEVAGVFNFYSRIDQAWVWSGDSYTALEPLTRGLACFDSHVNGSVVMKELKAPWQHWQSMSATMVLAADDPIRRGPWFASPPLTGAEDLELVVRAAVARWTSARLERLTASGVIEHPDRLLRQLIEGTTVNLASSGTEFRRLRPGDTLTPPLGFWLNNDVLLDVLEIPANFEPPTMSGDRYRERVEHYGFRLEEGDFIEPGDNFFAFMVPEAALEDTEVIDQMIRRGILSARFVACVLMVDFPNPVFSTRRAALMRHCPRIPQPLNGLTDILANAITSAVGLRPAGSPEAEFAANWAVAEDRWREVFAARITAYMEAVTSRLSTDDGTDAYVRLAVSRRQEFAGRPLFEFRLTQPTTDIPTSSPALAVHEDGSVHPRQPGKENEDMAIAAFDPPGNLTDLNSQGRQVWHEFIDSATEQAIAGNPGSTHDSPRAQYYNLARTDTAADAITQDVSWIAFPRQVRLRSTSDRQRWAAADGSRDVQDEYCEWSVTRDAEGRILRVTFTCEGPEYWEVLAETDPAKVVSLYQEHVNPEVREQDLFDSQGRYISRNRWNTDTVNGAMHLVQAANTLSAEIELCAAASIVREIDGRVLTGEQELIECGSYGAPQRNSDPHIGGVVNSVARLKADLALANPVGLYFNDLSTAGWQAPDGADPKAFWTYTRGDAGHRVRAVYEVPADRGYTVSDIMIRGRAIRFAAQITDFISIKATAVACRIGKSTVAPMTACVGAPDALIPPQRGGLEAFSRSRML